MMRDVLIVVALVLAAVAAIVLATGILMVLAKLTPPSG